MNITQFKEHLTAELHGGTLNKVRNFEGALERASNTLLSKIDPLDTIRTATLSTNVKSDVYDYVLPLDYKDIIDLYPSTDRNSQDAFRSLFSQPFDLKKEISNRNISIESNNGLKNIRINWRNSVTAGLPFSIKYYSKYVIRTDEAIATATWKSKTDNDDDIIVLDNDCINGLIYETLIECAQQIEGTDSVFDITYANEKLYGNAKEPGFYANYRGRYPTQAKKKVGSYYNMRRFR